MFRGSVAVFSTLFFMGAVVAQQDPPKPPIVKVSAEDIVKEFQINTDAAVQKYLPPKPGTPGGVLVCITGVVAAVDARNNEIGLAGPGGRVVIHAKNLNGVQVGDKIEAVGTFGNYIKRTILVYCDEIKPVKS